MAKSGDLRTIQAATAPISAAVLRTKQVRLGTLNNLRWLAVAGQSLALLIVHVFFDFDFPLVLAAAPIVASAVLNVILAAAYPAAKRLSAREATAFLGYDILQLAALLYFTGGIENPFALLFLAPVVVSAATLDMASTFFLGALSFAAITVLALTHFPLPWADNNPLHLPALYQRGIWVSLLLGIGFTSMYAWRIASEATRMSAALSATQMTLAREHRLASLGALAAAAAHELGTPLGTIAVVAHELERELSGTIHAEDCRLLRDQAERCRAILARLGQPEEAVLGRTEQLGLGALLDDIAAPHRGVDVAISIDMQSGPAPKIWRVPEILHGLGNLIENAADFAARDVRLRARWDDKELSIDVIDDGPGFSSDIFDQIGEPYVTSRPASAAVKTADNATGKQEGMGLGFFIAKTLIEETGGKIGAHNRSGGGAVVTVSWPRGAIDGPEPPHQEFRL